MAERTDLLILDIPDKFTFTVTRYEDRYPWYLPRAWGIRRMSFGKNRWCDRWALDLPWVSLIFEHWWMYGN